MDVEEPRIEATWFRVGWPTRLRIRHARPEQRASGLGLGADRLQRFEGDRMRRDVAALDFDQHRGSSFVKRQAQHEIHLALGVRAVHEELATAPQWVAAGRESKACW